MGYTDTILDVKSQRVRALLGLTAVKPSEARPEPMVNGTKPSSPKDGGVLRYDATVGFSTLSFLLAFALTFFFVQ